MASGNDEQVIAADAANQRVTRPGIAFCSSSTKGMFRLIAARATGAQAYPPDAMTSETCFSARIRRASRKLAKFTAANRPISRSRRGHGRAGSAV